MSGIGKWIERKVEHAGEALDEAGHAVASAARHAVGEIEAWLGRLSDEARLTIDNRSLAPDRPVAPDMDAFTRTATERANTIKDLVRLPGLIAHAAGGRLPGRKNVTDQVLDVLRSCKSAAEIDAVVSQVGRRPLLMRLNIAEGRDDGGKVKALIDQVRRSDIRPGDWGAFDRYLDQVTETRARPGSQVTLLDGAENAFPEIYKAIDGARESINLETYNFALDDAAGKEYLSHLAAAVKRGVTVNIMIDAKGTTGSDRAAALLRASGASVSVSKVDVLADRVDHRKVLVVDGRTGFTGGMNIADHRAGWRDMHSKIEGPAVQDLQHAFFDDWRSETGGVPPGARSRYFPPLAARGGQAVRIVPHTGGADENIRLAYTRALDTAERSITIADPYFTDSEVMDHVMRAARRGVDVKVVWPADNDEPIERAAARAHYAQLIAAGVKVYEYQPSMAHQKVAVVDGRFATLGSSNLDARSLRNDQELNMVSLDPAFAGRLQSAIDADLARSTRMTGENREVWDRPRNPLLRIMTFEDEV